LAWQRRFKHLAEALWSGGVASKALFVLLLLILFFPIVAQGAGQVGAAARKLRAWSQGLTTPRGLRLRARESLLRQVHFLSGLSPREIAQTAARMVLHLFPPGQIVVSEGAKPDRFYIVARGVAEMWVGDEPRPRRRLTRGDYFGETALLEREPHAATVRAGSWLSLFSIRRSDFDTWVAPHIGAGIDDQLYKLQALRRFPTFEAMPDRELDALASKVLRERFAPGAVICREGDPADAIYLVESGQAEVLVGKERRLLRPGSPFGKAAMLSRGPYPETVRALTPVDVFKLRRPDYEFLVAMSCAKGTTDVQDSAPDHRRRVCCTAPAGTA